MRPEDRQAPKLSSVKRTNAALKRAIAHQIKVGLAKAEYNRLVQQLQDLTDLNAGRIDGKIEDFMPRREKPPLDTNFR